MIVNEKVVIKDVAIYIRKSRVNETEKDLENHKMLLQNICERNGWKYTIYRETASSVSIEVRPEIQKLLASVKLGMYDAILVVDQDRLSRGDGTDTDYIKRVLKKSGTYICIGERVLNLQDDNDDTQYEFNAFFAKLEYKTIVKRLKRGKLARAMQGYWTNAIPPFPYEYDRLNRELLINQKQLKLYNLILDMYIKQGLSPNEIAFDLNNKIGSAYRTKKGGYWSAKTILDILLNETHLGKIVIGKSTGNGHKNRPSKVERYKSIDKSEWLIYEGRHMPVKTQEQHNQILMINDKNRKQSNMNSVKAKEILPLTGLLVCGICGSTIGLILRKENGKPYIKKCYHKDKQGNKCPNMSGNLQPVLDLVNQEVLKYYDKIKNEPDVLWFNRLHQLEEEYKSIEYAIKSQLEVIDRIDSAFEDGTYNKEKYFNRFSKARKTLNKLKDSKFNLETEVLVLQNQDLTQKRQYLEQYINGIQNQTLTYGEQNLLYKKIIKSITYTRLEKEKRIISIEFR